MKRPYEDEMHREPVEDACDRAHKMRVSGDVRIRLDQIGFWNINRGGMGLASHHLHEVTNSCCAHGISLMRYQHVPIVEIPQECLEEVRKYNRARCESDPLMPKYSEHIKYVCVGKTHFVHALKLLKDGNRFLYNQQDVQTSIRLKPSDAEGKLTQTEGPLCAIFRPDLFKDPEAMTALTSQDNLNASVQMEEDEMTAFGRVNTTVEQLGSKSVQRILTSLRTIGLGKFNADDYTNFIELRLCLDQPQAKVFLTCQFAVCSGRVSVKPWDFGLAAKLDPRAPWCMISLLLWQYIGTMNANTPAGMVVHNSSSFSGRQGLNATKMRKDVIGELTKESGFVKTVEKFILDMLKNYSRPSGGTISEEHHVHELLKRRAHFLADVGRQLINIGRELDTKEKTAIAKKEPLRPHQKLTVIKDLTKDVFSKTEQCFRKQLVDNHLYSCAALPPVLYQEEEAKASAPVGFHTAIPLAEHQINVKLELDPQVAHSQAVCEQWKQRLYKRLEVKGPGEEVMALPHRDRKVTLSHLDAEPSAAQESPLKLEEPVTAVLPSEVEEGDAQQPEEFEWLRCVLLDVEVHERMGADGRSEVDDVTATVHVQLLDESKRQMLVHPDDLRPCPKTITPAHVVVHPIQQPGGSALPDYVNDDFVDQHFINAAQNVLIWAQRSVAPTLAYVRVTRQSVDGKVKTMNGGNETHHAAGPLVLQVRAGKDFKKGTLVLVPSGGQVVDHSKAEKLCQTGALHASMVTAVPAWGKLSSIQSTANRNSTLQVISPLCDKRKHTSELANLNPFWAMLRCFQPTDQSNMVFEDLNYDDSGIDLKPAKLAPLPRNTRVNTIVTIARNSHDIAEGDVLVLPWSSNVSRR